MSYIATGPTRTNTALPPPPPIDRKDKDPLSNRDLLLHDIINVGRDGVGGAMAKRHGCMYRIDVLKQGKDVRGQTVLPEQDAKAFLGKGVGFSTLTVRNCETVPQPTPSKKPKRARPLPLPHHLAALRVAADLGGVLPPWVPVRLCERDQRDLVGVL